MTAYVLVGGAWMGGWCWQAVARPLRSRGHDVYPVTLTGLGERSHLAGPTIDLTTHITDIVNLIEFEGLRDVVLVGHSYAGVPVTGAGGRIPERIARLVYLDSAPIPSGLSYLDSNPPEVQQQIEQRVAEHGDGWRLPMPPWDEQAKGGASLDGLSDDDLRLMASRATPQPFGTYTQPLTYTSSVLEALPSLAILCSFSLAQVQELIAAGHPWGQAMSGPQWQYVELPTGHWPMYSRPNDVAEILAGLSSDHG
ncbi:MAG: alpha/beta fold hydrolase [Dehalococcoidia bacterium]